MLKTYGALALTESSPPQSFTEPLALDLVKEFLRVTSTDQDRTINEMITAARSHAEVMQNRDLIVKQWDYALDMFASFEAAEAAMSGTVSSISCGIDEAISLRRPLRTVELIQYRDADGVTSLLTENIDFSVDAARGQVLPVSGKTWPFFVGDVSSSILIRFTSGYARNSIFWSDAGSKILLGMKMLITGWYEDRIPYVAGLGLAHDLPYGVQTLLGVGAKSKIF